MTKRPWLYMVFGIFFLIVPTAIYLGFLIPKMSEEYNILMASGGIISTLGLYGAKKIPDSLKFSSVYKLVGKSFTIMVAGMLVEKFYMHIIGVVAVAVISYIVFIVFKELYKNAKRRKENRELATEITKSLTETIK